MTVGLLLAGADLGTVRSGGTPEAPVVTDTIPKEAMRMLAARVGQSLPVGNEGVVVAAGSSPGAQALLGRTVALLGGAMHSQYRSVRPDQCLLFPEGTTPAEALRASSIR